MELINNRDGFCCVGCVCGLGGVYMGCGWGRKLVLHWVGLFKDWGLIPPQVIGFLDVF